MTITTQAVLVTLLAALGCAESPSWPSQTATIRDSAGVRIVENSAATWTTPWQVADKPTLVIGSVEDDAGQALYQVQGALRLAEPVTADQTGFDDA